MTQDKPVVRLGMAPRMPHLTMQEFQAHWASEHAAVAAKLPGLRSYVQYQVVLPEGRPDLPYAGFDACSEMRFDSWGDMDDAFVSPEFRGAVQRDEARFVDKSHFAGVAGDELVLFGSGVSGELEADAVRVVLWQAVGDVASLVDRLARGDAAGGMTGRRLLINDAPEASRRMPLAADVVEYSSFDGSDSATESLRSPGGGNEVLQVAGLARNVGAMVSRARRIV